jgi:superfamily II RNA helicase
MSIASTKKLIELEDKHKQFFPHTKDSFQLNADHAIVEGHNVLVTAGTGCGKSAVIDFAIVYSIEKNIKIYITVPTIALANQFFNSYSKVFNTYGSDEEFVARVGLITGNNTINDIGSVLVVTAEVLRNKIQSNPEEGFDEMMVVMDEVHNINRTERGRVWEETISSLPSNAQLVMLSATIASPEKFIEYVETATGRKTIHTFNHRRVVPLHILVPYLRTITTNTSYPRDGDFIELLNTNNKDAYHVRKYDDWKKDMETNKMSIGHRLICLTNMLRLHDKFPAIIFAFSRRRNEEYANMILSLNLLTSCESTEMKHDIKRIVGKARYDSLQTLESFRNLESLLVKGIAYHHGGLIPILKDLVEILFREKKIKLLFATETLAVGVNMPTRSVVFTDLKKPTKNGFMFIGSDIYGQMSGRAGRRGMDNKGFVFWCPLGRANIPSSTKFHSIVNGGMPRIDSKFTLTSHFVLQNLAKTPEEVLSRLWRQIQNKDIAKGIDSEIASTPEQSTSLIEIEEYYAMECKINCKPCFLSHKECLKIKKRMKVLEDSVDGFKRKIIHYRKLIELKQQSLHTRNQLVEEWGIQIDYLTKHQYIDSNSLTFAGEVASTIHESDPLIVGWVLAELVEHPHIERATYSDIVGWLSILLESPYGRGGDGGNRGEDGVERSEILGQLLDETDFAHETLNSDIRLNFANADLVVEWIEEKNVTKLLGSLDSFNQGTFVKLILRLVNLIDRLRGILEKHKHFYLYNLLEDTPDRLMFDLVSNQSLYLM